VTYVIVSPCIDVKDGACQKACPVECIYEGGRMMYIQPDECIDCAVCVSVCPVQAIFAEDGVPANERGLIAINAEFFGPTATNWQSPGGAGPKYRTAVDHPLVAGRPKGSAGRGKEP
jgi:NAD-dependent dihydropyrimidine dehydrogenase PreA subunit